MDSNLSLKLKAVMDDQQMLNEEIHNIKTRIRKARDRINNLSKQRRSVDPNLSYRSWNV